ncbi:MAG: hypothetical protein ACLUVC_09435 [Longibaculum sp.]
MKKLEGLDQIGLQIDKKHDVAFGSIGGYKFSVTFLPQQRQYTIMTTVKNDNESGALSQYLESMKTREFVNWTNYNNYVLMINLKNDKNLTAWEIQKIIQEVASYMTQNGYVQCCRHCGQIVDIDVCSINGNNDMACGECLSNFAASQPQLKEVNLPLGIVGALAGSIIGVIVWVIIYQLGFVAGITGFIMAVCCFKGYEMLGGRIDKKGVWIAIVIAIVMLAAAEMISLGLEIQSAMNDYVYPMTFFESIRAIPYFLGESEIMGAVFKDLAFGYVFMAAASFSYVKNIQKRVNTEGVIERLG